MQFPLSLRFKIIALSPQISLTDAAGVQLCYIKQKLFKLKEKIEVFSDESRTQKVAEINADRIIDFSAKYTITDQAGNTLGSIKRSGMRSFWRSQYTIFDANENIAYSLKEKNPWTRMADGMFESIPLIGALSGYLFHPSYLIHDTNEQLCYTLVKKPAFLEGLFSLERQQETGDDVLIMLSVTLMSLLERDRG